jgi:uncharacterized protein (TIGR00159 family)
MMGIALLFALNFLTKWGGLYVTSWIFQYLWAIILLSLIILFQPEIRGILEEVSPLKVIRGRGGRTDPDATTETLAAAFDLASRKIGAIVVFPRKDSVEEFLQDGVNLESILSKPLIMSIFSPVSPLHDGAIIIRGSRIIKAGCFLPLTDSSRIPQYYGSRHRAAIGLTERTDAVCLVVSEERGEVSLWGGGKAWTCPTVEYASEYLEKLLQSGSQIKGPLIWKRWIHENFWIKVFSLAFALFLWGVVSGVKTSETSFNVPIEYTDIPAKMSLAMGGTDQVTVRVRGSAGLLAGISSEGVRARLNLSNAKDGTNFITITPEDLSLPPAVQITSIKPSVIRLVLERIETRTYRVEARFKDSLPPSYSLESIVIDPPEIKLEGPVSQLDKIKMVATEPLSLSGVTSDKRVTRSLEVVPAGVFLSQKELPKVTLVLKVIKGKGVNEGVQSNQR